jgi:hypothetical protein
VTYYVATKSVLHYPPGILYIGVIYVKQRFPGAYGHQLPPMKQGMYQAFFGYNRTIKFLMEASHVLFVDLL